MECDIYRLDGVRVLNVSPESIMLNSASGSSGTFNISSNVSWNITNNTSWLSVSPVSGSNNGMVTVTANSANTGTTERSATVTVSGTAVASKTVTVTQAPAGTVTGYRWVDKGLDGVWYGGRTGHAMAYLGDDKLLLHGGLYNGTYLIDSDVYDLSNNSWVQYYPTPRPSGRYRHVMAYIGNNRVLLFGGLGANNAIYGDTWLFDGSNNTWTQLSPASSPTARFDHNMVWIGDDKVMLFGGGNTFTDYKNDTWIFDLSDNTWTQRYPATSPSARRLHAMSRIGNGKAVLFGGQTGLGSCSIQPYEPIENGETWIYDIGTNTWTQLNLVTKPASRLGSALAFLGEGKAVLFGGDIIGCNSVHNLFDDTWIFDGNINTWSEYVGTTNPPALTMHNLAETSINGGNLVLFGGSLDGWGEESKATWVFESLGPPPTGCINETFTAGSGTITDNSGSSDYQNNMTCEKLIQPTGGGTITLTFTAFSTEATYDLVRVYAGSTTSAPLLGTFSGSTLPPVLTSSGGSMLIRFTTDGSVVAAGWSATYTSGPPPPTGCINETFTAASGTITDNSGSSDYQNNMTCEKLIQPTGGGAITLTFTSFATESGYDFVRVYAGSTTSAPLLGTFSGSTLPPVLTSGAGSMLIRFTTDGSVVAAGWSATYNGGPPPSGCINETFTTATGTITDNSGASDYQNNMTCEKLIQPTGGGAITLTFTSFATESGYDFVRVYSGSTTSAPLLGTFSGSTIPPVLTSSGGSMLIRFTTDGSVVAAGWSATYTSGPPPPTGCINETFTAASGTITDNSGASDYQNNMTCEKLIQPTGGGTITLTFTSFATESGYDFVRVYAGSTTSAPLLGTFSGSTLPPVLTSSGGSMLIRFTTDGSVVAAGWSATYTSGPPPPTGCINETFTAASGTITDNSGSSDYQNNMTCEKLIQPTGGGTITLTFTSFATESGYDFVRVYAGSTTSAPLLGTFSGSTLPPVLTSSGGSMLIRFTSDASVVAAGWSATYTSGPPPPTGCINETFTAASGTITDNSGALDYQNNMTCEKLIQRLSPGYITLTFTSFATESGYDYVRIYDGPTTSAALLGAFSGSSLPPTLTSSRVMGMLIRFTTDGSVVAAGWSATYTSSLTSGGKGAEEISEQENLQDTKLIAYPNPTSGILTVESSFTEEEAYTIDLMNIYGQVILNQRINVIGGKFDIDMSELSSGSYLLRIMTNRTVQFIHVIKH